MATLPAIADLTDADTTQSEAQTWFTSLRAFLAAAVGTDSASVVLKLDDLATPDDNTDLNASTSQHGLFPKLNNGYYYAMNGQGSWIDLRTINGGGGIPA